MSLWPRTISILISNWPQTRKFNQLFKSKSREDRCFSLPSPYSRVGHALRPILKLSKFDRWVHAENLYSILKLVYFGSLSWQSFFCQLFHWIHKMKYSCYQDRESSVIHGLFIEFLVQKCAACQSRKSDFGWHRFRSPCWMQVEKVSSDSGLTW